MKPMNWWEPGGDIAIRKVAGTLPGSSPLGTREEIEARHDDLFAYVKEAGRGLPIGTQAETALSMVLFKEAAADLDEADLVETGRRLKAACDFFDLEFDFEPPAKEASDPEPLPEVIDVAAPNPEMVKAACDFFTANQDTYDADFRQATAESLVKQAQAADVDLSDYKVISAWGGPDLREGAADVVWSRIATDNPAGDIRAKYEKLAGYIERDEVDLNSASSILSLIDAEAGRPPANTRIELAGVKTAAPWSAFVDGEQVTNEMLSGLDNAQLAGLLGDDFAQQMADRPAEAFMAMPQDIQRVVKDMAYGRG